MIQHVRPANTEVRITPEKEDGDSTNKDNEMKSGKSGLSTPMKGNNKANKDLGFDRSMIADYSAVDNNYHPDFGQNGFLDADNFQSGDQIPLMKDNLLEARGDIYQPSSEDLITDDRDLRSTSNNTDHSVDRDGYGGYHIDEWSNNEGQRFQKPRMPQPYENEAGLQNGGNPAILHHTGMNTSNTTGTNTTNIAAAGGFNNNSQLFNEIGQHRHNQPATERNQAQRKRRKQQNSKEKGQIIKPQEQPGYVGDRDVDDILKALGLASGQQSQPQKANSPALAGANGASATASTKKQAKKQKQKLQRQQQVQNNSSKQQLVGPQESNATSPPEDEDMEEEEMEVDIELDTEGKVESQQEGDAGHKTQEGLPEEGNKIAMERGTTGEGEKEEGNLALDDDNVNKEKESMAEEEDKGKQKDEANKWPKEPNSSLADKASGASVPEQEQPQQSDAQQQQQSANKQPRGNKWVSRSVAAKKEEHLERLMLLMQTPLLKRVPFSVLHQLPWKCPITIVNPFLQQSLAAAADEGKEEQQRKRAALWEGPADQWLEQKPMMTMAMVEKPVDNTSNNNSNRKNTNKNKKKAMKK